MVRETTEAKIEFHERYWSKVSDEGEVSDAFCSAPFVTDKCAAKIFVKTLLNPDPSQRPTAQEAYNNHVSDCFTNWPFTHNMGFSSG